MLVAGAVLTVGGDDRVIRPRRCPPESSEGGGGRGPDRGADPRIGLAPPLPGLFGGGLGAIEIATVPFRDSFAKPDCHGRSDAVPRASAGCRSRVPGLPEAGLGDLR